MTRAEALSEIAGFVLKPYLELVECGEGYQIVRGGRDVVYLFELRPLVGERR